MNLHQLQPGHTGRILDIHSQGETTTHLHHMGFHVGETITCIAHLGSNIIVAVQGTRYGIDRALARLIEVTYD